MLAGAFKLGAAGGGDVKAPDQEEELDRNGGGGQRGAAVPRPNRGRALQCTRSQHEDCPPHRGVEARERPFIRRPVGRHFYVSSAAQRESFFIFPPPTAQSVVFI